MKKIAILIILLISSHSFSQNAFPKVSFGVITKEERELKKYKLDTTANALVLYESGNTSFKLKDDYIAINTKYYKKIKIFNIEGYKHATFKIPIYNNKLKKESVKGITAFTHYDSNKTVLKESSIFNERINENWSEVKFTLPNLKEGCIIEVEYTVETPFKFNLTGWEFQSDIPKIYSQYEATIPGNYVYNRILNGYLKLNVNTAKIKKRCFKVPRYPNYANCEVVTYAMKDIPAFIEEDYLTSSDNFISKIKFELSEFKWFDGSFQKFTKTWKSVDREFKSDKNIGGQIRKTKFFRGKLPIEIHSLDSNLEKAKAVYSFIQNHYTWNEKNSIFKNVKVKKAYENKIGNVGEINISLINSLKAVGLNAELMLISTRDNGTPTKLHPVITDFNYVIVKLNINNTTYLLDATSKIIPFGLLPLKCLNSYGRVMDFKNPSYWYNIIPSKHSRTQLFVNLFLNSDGSINGELQKLNFGQFAISRREKITNKNEDEIISEFEADFDNIEVNDYKIQNKTKIDKPIIETFEIVIENPDEITTHFLNPFFSERFTKNPFKQENRLYPVNFGYPIKHGVYFTLQIPGNYTIESFPGSRTVIFQEKDTYFNLTSKKTDSSFFELNSVIRLNKPIYYDFEYESLKVLFNHIINSQKIPIVLKRK